MRVQHSGGTLLKLDVKLTERKETSFLFAHHKAPFEKVTVDDARRLIDMMYEKFHT